MKHLLILLISILLLSSPLFGQETGVLYQHESSSGIKWKTFGNGKVQPKYEGEITNGKPNGQGTHTYSNGEIYVGKWKGGSPWIGTKYNKSGKILGKWIDGKFQ